VDPNIRQGLDGAKRNQRLDNAGVGALRVYRIDMRQWRTAHCDRHRMQAGVAGFKVRDSIAFLVMRWRTMMLVRGESVVVLRMIVIGVRVDVQRRDLA
jgi:hypothetical protein